MSFFSALLKLFRGQTVAPNTNLLRVYSHSDPSVFYLVDTELLSCSCPDWTKRRSEFPDHDVRRLCKHLTRHVSNSRDLRYSTFMGTVERFALLGWGIPVDRIPDTVSADGVILGVLDPAPTQENPWYSVSFNGQEFSYSKRFDKWGEGRPLPSPALELFLGHVYGQVAAGGPISIVTTHRSKDIADIPTSLQGSWGVSKKMLDNGGWVAFGSVEGVTVRAFINPRADWQSFLIGEDAIPYNVKIDDWRGPSKYAVLRRAATAWLLSEFNECRAKK